MTESPLSEATRLFHAASRARLAALAASGPARWHHVHPPEPEGPLVTLLSTRELLEELISRLDLVVAPGCPPPLAHACVDALSEFNPHVLDFRGPVPRPLPLLKVGDIVEEAGADLIPWGAIFRPVSTFTVYRVAEGGGIFQTGIGGRRDITSVEFPVVILDIFKEDS